MATRKQAEAIKIISANIGISTAKAMQMAGYSKAMSRQPQVLTKSKGFAELAQEFLPEDKLLSVAQEGLNADKVIRYKGQEFTDPDYYARHLYLQTALKIRNLAQTADTPIGDITINVVNYGDATPPIKSVTAKDNGDVGSPPSVKGDAV